MPVPHHAGAHFRGEHHGGSAAATASGSPATFDTPPPSTITCGSSTLITVARLRAARSTSRARVASAAASPAAARAMIVGVSTGSPVTRAWSAATPGPEIQRSTHPARPQ